jgi:hypothetical protein
MEYTEKETYQRKILQTYQESFGGRVEHFLVRPTPGNVKKAVVEVAGLALSASDGQMLKKGLGLDDTKPLLEQINKKDSDDFKTLSNFLKRKTTDTDHTNLDVIAVLIDFNPRPFSKFKKVWKEETFVNVLKDAKPQSVPMGTYVDETFSVEEIASNKILKTPKIHPLLKWGIGGTLFLVLLFSTYHFAAKEKAPALRGWALNTKKCPAILNFWTKKEL